MSNKEDSELNKLYKECKEEYPHIPDIALLIECQNYLKNPNKRTNKNCKHLINKMKQRHHEQYIEELPDEEKTKWKDKNTYIGVRFEDNPETIIENTNNLVIED